MKILVYTKGSVQRRVHVLFVKPVAVSFLKISGFPLALFTLMHTHTIIFGAFINVNASRCVAFNCSDVTRGSIVTLHMTFSFYTNSGAQTFKLGFANALLFFFVL